MNTEHYGESKKIFLIHTVPGLIPILAPLMADKLPDWDQFNIADESLLKDAIRDGELSPATMRRLLGHVWAAVDAGADAVLVTCSSLGPAIDAAQPFCPVPLVRIDKGMAIEAVSRYRRIGILATLSSTLAPTTALVEATAAESNGAERCAITSRLCEGAFDHLARGDAEAHDRMVASTIESLAPEVDVIVFAQASMARALARCDPRIVARTPVLTSPEPGIAHLARVLGDGPA